MRKMSVKNMNAGDAQTSYSKNSALQKVVIRKTWAVLDESLKDMFTDNHELPKCLKMADLGCSSGPNTLFLISHIMDTIKQLSKHNDLQLEVFLNDLPDNDFNNLFKHLPSFCRENRKLECFIYAAPSSFYARLFPSNSLHFAYSSYSLHWLSQVPEGLEKNNKENIYIATTSPPQVFEVYLKQFQRDLFMFLSSRGQEITPAGRMVLSFIARPAADPFFKDASALFTLLAETLSDMVAEGLVKEDDLHSFNMSIYYPCLQEVEASIDSEGSFKLEKMEVVEVPWDANEEYDNMVFDKYKSAKLVLGCVRAFIEPMLADHFGSSILDYMFDIYAKKIGEHLSIEIPTYYTAIISLTRK